jgi:hypothetical protein
MQYQITKYVMRWKDKHPTVEKRIEDLKKARHFLDKYIEDAEAWDREHVRLPAEQIVVRPRTQEDIDHEWEHQEEAKTRFSPDGFTMGGARYQCLACRQVFVANSPLGAERQHSRIDCERWQQDVRTGRVQPSGSTGNGAATLPHAPLPNAS